MIRDRGLAFRLSLLIAAGSILVVGLAFGYNYVVVRRLIVRNISENAHNLALTTVNRVQAVLAASAKIPENMAAMLEHSTYSEDQLVTLIREFVANNREVFGAAVAFEPHAFRSDALYFAPYCYRRQGTLEFINLGSETYRYFTMDWYQMPKELGRAVWSEPYYDEGGGGIVMSTYSVPFFRTVDGTRRFMGVVTVDLSLQWLQAMVSSIRISQTGYAFLLSRNGVVVTHPQRNLIMNETIFSIAEARNDPALRDIGRAMIRGESGFVPRTAIVSDQPGWLVYAPVPANGWSLGALFPHDELLADVSRLNRTVVGLAAGGIALLLILVVSVARSITGPLLALTRASEDLARGELDTVLPAVTSADEVGRLAGAFARMQRDLKRYIEDLKETAAAREQLSIIRKELDIASHIQQSILPRTFPPFPERTDFEIFAAMIPAREVGGDFYDFFLIDHERLAVVIGDVSGKGVPAAIFMAISRTLLRSTALTGSPPAQCLYRVNALLCAENSSDMFVTLFYGVLNTRTGVLDYANGGHNPPYVLRRSGTAEALEGTGGMVLGAMDDVRYRAKTVNLAPGDGIVLYTDGITEAMDAAGNLFSEQRLEKVLAQLRGAAPETIVHGVVDAVKRYAADAAQNDDLTLLAVRRALMEPCA